MEAATIIKAVGTVFSGASALSAAKAEKQKSEINAYIGRTRAMESDTVAREGLTSELGSMRSALAANGQRPNVGTFAAMRELRQTRNRERRIEFGNDMQTVADFRTRGRNAMSAGRAKFASSILSAGPSLFDLYEMRNQ